MKTLRTIVMAGAVALTACNETASTKNEHIISGERNGYLVRVTDQETHRVNLLPRHVAITAMENTMTPFAVVGYTQNALAPNPSFDHGYLQRTVAPTSGCWWGPKEYVTPCTAAEARKAQQMLKDYAIVVTQN
jgi:hypothetical protein